MKKRNVLRKITALILIIAVFIPTNIYAADDKENEKRPADPNIYVDDYANTYNVADLEIYYNHPHWTQVYNNIKENWQYDFSIKVKATLEYDGVVDSWCPVCNKDVILRIPKIVSGGIPKNLYYIEDILLNYKNWKKNEYRYSDWGEPKIKPYLVDSNNHKITENTYWLFDYDKTVDTHEIMDIPIDYYTFVGKQYINIFGDNALYNVSIPASYSIKPLKPDITGATISKNQIAIGGTQVCTKYKDYFRSGFFNEIKFGGSEVKIADNKSFKNAKTRICYDPIIKKIYKVKSSNGIFKNLKYKNYYFKMRFFTYVDGKKIYSDWSTVKRIKPFKNAYKDEFGNTYKVKYFKLNKKYYYPEYYR